MKASDISDEDFVATLPKDGRWINRIDVAEKLGVPEKVALAKARTLIVKNRGVHGCYCGCRGDFHIAEGCRGCRMPS